MFSVSTMLFPELTRFPSRGARKDAWGRAEKATLRQPLLWVLVIATIAAYGIIVFSLPTLGIPVEWRGRVRGIMLLLGCLFFAAIPFFFRRTVQRSLRRQLCDSGVPVCISCGYDLAGNTTGECPECGSSSRPSRPQ